MPLHLLLKKILFFHNLLSSGLATRQKSSSAVSKNGKTEPEGIYLQIASENHSFVAIFRTYLSNLDRSGN